MPAKVTPDLQSQAKEKGKISPNEQYFFELSRWHTAKQQIHLRNVRKTNICIVKPRAKDGPARSPSGGAQQDAGFDFVFGTISLKSMPMRKKKTPPPAPQKPPITPHHRLPPHPPSRALSAPLS